MKDIDDYFHRACEVANLDTSRKLSKKLGISEAAISQLRSKKRWPSDATMIGLATLADLDIGQALCDLNIWRAKSKTVAGAYTRLAERI